MKEKFAFKKLFLGMFLGALLLGSLSVVSAGGTEADTTVIIPSTEDSGSDNGAESIDNNTESIDNSTESINSSEADSNADNSSSSPQTGSQTERVDFPLLLLIGCLGFTVIAICAKKKNAF